jgi:hypothetical protein
MDPDTELGYCDRVVAYADILGFRRLVLQNHDDAERTIRRLDETIQNTLKCLALDTGSDWFSVKLFSDCFCISCRESDLITLFMEMSFLQWNLACGGIFVRGGLSVGRHYENARIIFSEGLIRAYELQSADPYPRITIDPVVIERIRAERNDNVRSELLGFVLRGCDSVCFLDYLEYSGTEGDWNKEDMLEAHKHAILEEVASNSSRPEVLAKYRWLAEYHNFKFHECFVEDEWVEGYFQTLRERLCIPHTAFPSFQRVHPTER